MLWRISFLFVEECHFSLRNVVRHLGLPRGQRPCCRVWYRNPGTFPRACRSVHCPRMEPNLATRGELVRRYLRRPRNGPSLACTAAPTWIKVGRDGRARRGTASWQDATTSDSSRAAENLTETVRHRERRRGLEHHLTVAGKTSSNTLRDPRARRSRRLRAPARAQPQASTAGPSVSERHRGSRQAGA